MFSAYLRRLYYSNYILCLINWARDGYSVPCPYFIKRAVLIRNSLPGSTWIETGTYLGSTTKFLSKFANVVYSIEPDINLYNLATANLRKFSNITILNGTSENLLSPLLKNIYGDINFWLDGHYSAGLTYQGENETPIKYELDAISENINNFNKISIFVDDIRCFNPDVEIYFSYPTCDYLIDWGKRHGFKWSIEFDILILKNF